MQKIKDFLHLAKEQNIVGSKEVNALLVFADQQNKPKKADEGFILKELSELSDADDQFSESPSEAPRLVRGFHDVLISIGIFVFLIATWGLLTPIAVILSVIVLSEVFVKRQRLALPAFFLATFLVTSSFSLFSILFGPNTEGVDFPIIFSCIFVVLSIYYWRYRVPIALASLIVIALTALFMFVLVVLGIGLGDSLSFMIDERPKLVGFVGVCFAVSAFFIAMYFDVKDISRITRHSDVAFWMHLGLAPLLIYSMLFMIFGKDGFWWGKGADPIDAVVAILVVTFMIFIGIIIDRRAFVTSGLVSLGAAVYLLTKEIGFDKSTLFLFSLLALGIIVLLLGAGWSYLRKIIVSRLPDWIKSKIPVVA